MKKRPLLLASVDISATASDDNKPVWIQLAKSGSFRGHAAGPFELNADVFSQILANFNASQNKRIPIDYEHLSEADDIDPTMGAPAQGWIVDLKIDGSNLWGLVEWVSDVARQQIRSKQYMFLSPAVVFGSKDPVTGDRIGARLSSAAITNHPFLDGMQPLAASRRKASGGDPSDEASVVRDALGLPDEASADQALAAIDAIGANLDRNVGVSRLGSEVAQMVQSLKVHLRLPAHASWDEIRDSAKRVIAMSNITNTTGTTTVPTTSNAGDTNMGADEKVLASMQASNADLQTKNAELTVKLSKAETDMAAMKASMQKTIDEHAATIAHFEAADKAREDKRVQSLVDNAIAHCGAKPELKDALLTMARKSPAEFEALYPMAGSSHAYLFSKQPLAAGRNGEPPAQTSVGGVVPEQTQQVRKGDISDEIPSHAELQQKYLAKGMTLEDATLKAHNKIVKMVAKLRERAAQPQTGGAAR